MSALAEAREAPLRQSHIAAHDACPLTLRFDLESGQRQGAGRNGYLGARGVLFHRFAAACLRHMWDHGEPEIDVVMAMDILKVVLSQRGEDHPSLPVPGVPDDDVVHLPMQELRWLRILATMWCHQQRFSVGRIIAIETRLYADLEVEGPEGTTYRRTITGQPDVLLAGPRAAEATLVDWKSGFAPPPQRRARAAEGDRLSDMGYVQQVVYGWLVLRNYPSVQRVTLREYYVMEKTDPVREAFIDRHEAERIEDVLAARVAQIDAALEAGPESDRWFPVPGTHCGFCPRPRHCPIKAEVGIPATVEEAQRLGREWIVAGEIRKERLPLLKGWVDARGPFEIAHSKGRREVGWVESKDGSSRSFRLYEPSDADESPFDADLERALEDSLRERGLEVPE